MVQRGDTLELRIENFASQGKCVARYNGFVVFVPGVVPGDTVRVQIERVRQNFAEGVAAAVLSPSPLRTSPPCAYFGVCGGCTWQHVQYQAQLDMKRQNLIDAFERIGGFKDLQVLPTLAADEIYFYRNKLEFSFSREKWNPSSEEVATTGGARSFALGFHHAGRFDKVIDVNACLLQSEFSNGVLQAVREFCLENKVEVYDPETQSGYLRFLVMREGKNTGERMVNLVTFEDRSHLASLICAYLLERFPSLTTFVNTINSRQAQVATGDFERVYHGNGRIVETLGKYKFRISANSFFQTNTRQAEKLFDLVKRLGDFKQSDTVYDLYSGTGSLSIFISDAVKKVVGIEVVQSAVGDAEENAKLNGVTNCVFLVGDLKEKLTRDTRWMDEHGKPDVLIIDPPRSGMHPKVVQRIARLQPPRILYVSCNPGTQARDIRALAVAGYRLDHLQPVDLFPQTYHVESVARLVWPK